MSRCENCPRNCCENFKIAKELINPTWVENLLKDHPYIIKTGTALVHGPYGKEVVVGIYNCLRFDQKNRQCRDYNQKPRPEICLETGEKFFPHNKCLLIK